MPTSSVTAVAPAGVGNVAVGFDVLGHALQAASDSVSIRAIREPGVRIDDIRGIVTDLPRDAQRNAATAGLLRLVQDRDLEFGLAVSIEKGIPLGSGMGGSAASAVAGIVAANALLGGGLGHADLLEYAADGEAAASGARHFDNVAPALLGGLVLTQVTSAGIHLSRISVPDSLRCVLVHPHLELSTRNSREVLPAQFARHLVTRQMSHLAGLIVGCQTGDMAQIGASLRDDLVEPFRAPLIPGFLDVKQAAMDSGALGCSISGGGPSVFAWFPDKTATHGAMEAMRAAFTNHGLTTDAWISPVNAGGARVI